MERGTDLPHWAARCSREREATLPPDSKNAVHRWTASRSRFSVFAPVAPTMAPVDRYSLTS
jgi:hypothetical protein